MPHRHTLTVALCCVLAHAQAAEPTAPADPRTLVEMPATAQSVMRQDMLNHLSTLNAIVAALGKGDLNGAATTAEQQLGRASMGRHRGTGMMGMGPGRFMSPEMRDIGWRMHDAADAFATIARKGDAQKAIAALEQVTTSCVTCHATYRTR